MSVQRDDWISLYRRLGAAGDGAATYQQLVSFYNEPSRAYHNLNHISHCLSELESARQICPRPDDVAFALWFHDAIYDSTAKDNEEQSAALAWRAIRDANLSENFGQRVEALILATKHAAAPVDPDAQVIVDVDLAILGQAEDIFDAYERNIRKEYAWVPDGQFRAGRSAVLKSFLARPAIYATDMFRKKFEPQARNNLQRSLDFLSRG